MSRFRTFRLALLAAALVALLAACANPAVAPEAERLPGIDTNSTAGAVAFDMVGSDDVNLSDYVNAFAGAFDSLGDGFQKYRRGVSPSIPFAVLDDSAGSFTPDTLGIVGTSNTDEFFGIVDTENGDNSGPVTATWTFDVSSTNEPLALHLDVGAMGDFESSDFFEWSYVFDGDPSQVAFASATDEDGSQTYTLESGTVVEEDDPLTLQGTVLTNDFATFVTPLSGQGDVLVLTLTAEFNGGSEAVAFQSLMIAEADAAPPPSSPPFINELEYDSLGSDTGEAVEIAGPAGTDLTGWSIVFYNGANGSDYATVSLTGALPDEGAGYGAASFLQSGIQNGSPDGLALVDPSGAVVQFLSYEGTLTANSGPAAGLTSTDIGVFDSNSVDGSLQLTGCGTEYDDFTWTGPTAGSLDVINADQTFAPVEECPEEPVEVVFIHEIQGDGAATPLDGQTVTVEAIVVGDFQDDVGENGDLNGFYLQEEDADADTDPATSEGIFVFQGNNPAVDIEIGDLVRLTGTAGEFFGETQLSGVSDLEIVLRGNPLPTPATITLPLASTDALEAFEGMSVLLPEKLVISEYFEFGRFGQVVLGNPLGAWDRPFQPTSYVDPLDAADVFDLIELNRIVLDDGNTFQNPFTLRHPAGGEFGLDNLFRGGDTLTDVVGALRWSRGSGSSGDDAYRVMPTGPATYDAVNPRTIEPEDVGGSLTVAAFNVLNYFSTIDEGDFVCGPEENQECRGADSEFEFERQEGKIVAALAALDADVVGLIEIQNNAGSVQTLVDALNAELGSEVYAAAEDGVVGTDAIKVSLIYKPATVVPLGDPAVLDTPDFLDPNDLGSDKNRAALAQTFVERVTGGVFTTVVNHFKSKGSGCGPGDDDPVQGNCNLTRTLAAEELAAWIATDPTGSGDPDVTIVGDLNAYDEEDPIASLAAAGFADLLEGDDGEFVYTYVFDGLFGHLDYALGNPSLDGQVTGATAWHINADEPGVLGYDTRFKPQQQVALFEPDTPYRSSDHDPVLIGLGLDANPGVLIEFLQAEVADLDLNRGLERSLTIKLEQALRSIDRGQVEAAAGQLGAFINEVADLADEGILDPAVATDLIELAQVAIDAL